MLYTEKEKHEIERVKEVFAEHLRQSPDFELLWSDKVGYVWLTIGVNPVYVDTGIRIESAADLCGKCLDDVATDVLYMTGNDHALEAADPLELAEIKRLWEPYINQLPDYAYRGARLAPFDIKEVREITMYDELELDLVGDRKTALFFIISDTDATFNFLVSMAYTQLFNLLCERADDKFGGRLPVHVRCLIDEAANIGQIPNLEKLMATIRSREISACLVLQAQSQLKALYKDNMDTIIGNCDSSLFLGGKEETTLKSWNSLLGKETIDLYNTSVTKGTQESHGQNFQKLGKDLMSVDELAVMDGGKCLLQIRGVRPFLSRKYDITKHPNYKYLSDFDEKNAFDIEKYLSTRLPVRPRELYPNYEITPEELAAQTSA